MTRKQILTLLAAAAVSVLAAAVSAQDISIVHAIPRHHSGYGGGVEAFYHSPSDFRIYESWVHSASDARPIFIKDPVAGTTDDAIMTSYQKGYHDLAYDSKRNVFWVTPWGGPVAWIPVTGGSVQVLSAPTKYLYGIFYDEEIDRLWVGSSYYQLIVRVNPDTGETEEVIEVDHGFDRSRFDGPTGLVKVGDNFLIGVAGDFPRQAGQGYIVEIDRQGNRTARPPFLMPVSRFSHDVGGFALDREGYLWVKGGKDTAIYRMDIGYTPPSPWASSPVLDSGDYTGDGTSDLAVFRPDSGLWAIRDVTRAYFGQPGDIPASGDYTGDGTTDIALFRPSTGLWAIRDGMRTYFGAAGDIPVPGDYSGDGTVEPAIFRPSSGLWAIRGLTRVFFGTQGDQPVPFYPSGRDDAKEIALFRPSTGLWAARGMTRVYFGREGDQPLLGSFDPGAYSASPAIFRPSNALWAFLDPSRTRIYFGREEDHPVLGNFTGFLPDQLGIFRPESGLWAIRDVTRAYFGAPGDIPVSGFSINPSTAAVI